MVEAECGEGKKKKRERKKAQARRSRGCNARQPGDHRSRKKKTIRQLQCETVRPSQNEMLKLDSQAAAIRNSKTPTGAGKRWTFRRLRVVARRPQEHKTGRYCCKARATGTSLERTANKDKTVIAGTRRALSHRKDGTGPDGARRE